MRKVMKRKIEGLALIMFVKDTFSLPFFITFHFVLRQGELHDVLPVPLCYADETNSFGSS